VTRIILFLSLSLLSYLGLFLIRRWVEKRRILDNPNERSSHTVPTPRGGGLAIVVLVLLTALGSGIINGDWKPTLIFFFSGIILAFLGWQDDVRSLSPLVRFPVQGLVAAVSIWGLGYFKAVTIPLFGEWNLGVVGVVITFLWIMGLTNAYNFMDGIDGIAGGVAFAAGLGWMLLTSNIEYLANALVFWVALGIAATSLGFLGHNWHPARIFMGDVASTFLGYSFAVMPLLASDQEGDALMLGTLLMWTFIMDAGVTFIRRALKRENVLAAHRTHLYQRMLSAGGSHAAVSSLYITMTFLAVLLAYGWMEESHLAPALILIGLPVTWVILSRFTPWPEHAD
jgi:UDP-N-acetylmuramyl pentapeptide phosphotransferase/UDP-N-acetylglucosamine-1-phosphate transferase